MIDGLQGVTMLILAIGWSITWYFQYATTRNIMASIEALRAKMAATQAQLRELKKYVLVDVMRSGNPGMAQAAADELFKMQSREKGHNGHEG